MKFVTLVVFLFVLNVSASVINTMEVTTGFGIQPQQAWLSDVEEEEIKGATYFQSSAVQDASSNFGFGDFVKGLGIFLGTFALGVVAPAYLFIQFGMPLGLAASLSLPIYLVYSLGIAQLVSNRATKTMG